MSENSLIPASGGESLISFIERAARDESFNVEKFSALLGERAKIERELQRRAYHAALSEVQSEMGLIVRDRANDITHSRYATLEALDREARPIYTNHGFAISYGSLPPTLPGHIRISCTVSHRDGHSETYELQGPVSNVGAKGGKMAMNDIQAVGAAVTYMRRYLIMMLFNLVQADDPLDDDGNLRRPKSGLRDKKVADRMTRAETEQQHGNGNGNGNGKPTIREWFDSFQADCDSADTVEECEAILKREQVMNCDEVFAKYPDTLAAIKQIKEGMMKRIYQGDPGNLDEPTPLSHVP